MNINFERNYLEGKVKGYQFKIKINSSVVSREYVKSAMEQVGLSTDYLSDPTQKRIVCRAACDTAKTNKRFKDHLARKVTDNAVKMVIGIVDEDRVEETETLAYDQTTTIRFDKENRDVKASGVLANEFNQNYEKYSAGITGYDIRDTIYRIMFYEAKAIALIESGHLYFVPYENRGVIQKVDALIKQLNIGVICCCEIIDTDNSNQWIWESAQNAVKSKIVNVMRNIDKIVQRTSALDKKNASLSEASDLLKSYANLTGFGAEMESVLKLIDSATSKISMKIVEISKQKTSVA